MSGAVINEDVATLQDQVSKTENPPKPETGPAALPDDSRRIIRHYERTGGDPDWGQH